jgi:hypothetical protein
MNQHRESTPPEAPRTGRSPAQLNAVEGGGATNSPRLSIPATGTARRRRRYTLVLHLGELNLNELEFETDVFPQKLANRTAEELRGLAAKLAEEAEKFAKNAEWHRSYAERKQADAEQLFALADAMEGE